MPALVTVSQNGDFDLQGGASVFSWTATQTGVYLLRIALGDGVKDLDGTGGAFTLTVAVAGRQLIFGSANRTLPAAVTQALLPINNQHLVPIASGELVTVYILSPNAADTDVDVTVSLFDVSPAAINASGHVTPADDSITAGKFDESTAFPLTSADTGATAVARTGADSDTLETLSDEIAAVQADTTETLTRVPDATPGAAGGLPTVDANNRIAGIQGTLTTLDGLSGADGDTLKVLSGQLDELSLRRNQATAGGASTITLDASASATNDYYTGQTIALVGGTGAGQARRITGYVGSTKVVTVNRAWVTNPSTDTIFRIVPGELEDIYTADVELNLDEGNEQDEWTVVFWKNGVPIDSGVTTVQIQVRNRADGTDLIAASNMTEISTTERWKYDATLTERTAAGEAVLARVTATIDGATRTFEHVHWRDV